MARDVDALDLQKLKVLLRRFDKVGLRLLGLPRIQVPWLKPRNSGTFLIVFTSKTRAPDSWQSCYCQS